MDRRPVSTQGRIEKLGVVEHDNDSKVEVSSADFIQDMWKGKSNMLVVVRVRPCLQHDRVLKEIITVMENKMVVIMDPNEGDKSDILRANRSREKRYAFDHVFDPVS